MFSFIQRLRGRVCACARVRVWECKRKRKWRESTSIKRGAILYPVGSSAPPRQSHSGSTLIVCRRPSERVHVRARTRIQKYCSEGRKIWERYCTSTVMQLGFNLDSRINYANIFKSHVKYWWALQLLKLYSLRSQNLSSTPSLIMDGCQLEVSIQIQATLSTPAHVCVHITYMFPPRPLLPSASHGCRIKAPTITWRGSIWLAAEIKVPDTRHLLYSLCLYIYKLNHKINQRITRNTRSFTSSSVLPLCHYNNWPLRPKLPPCHVTHLWRAHMTQVRHLIWAGSLCRGQRSWSPSRETKVKSEPFSWVSVAQIFAES